MSTRAIKRKRDEGPLGGDFKAPPETAPSVLRADEPVTARAVAIVALFAAAVGAFALILYARGWRPLVGPAGAVLFLATGIAGLLFHAASEKDMQLRRVYGLLGAALLAAGILLRLLPIPEGVVCGLFLPAGVPCLGLALAFLLAFARNETDAYLHFLTEVAVGAVGLLLVLSGAIGGLVSDHFLLTQGVVMLVLGLFYAAGFMALQPVGSQRGYGAGLGLGILGAIMIVLSLGYLILPDVFGFLGWARGQPGPPFLYLYAGIEFVLLSVGVCSDARLVVMTRRELGAYFHSPIAYVVLVAVALVGGLRFVGFLDEIATAPFRLSQFGMPEPVVAFYVFNFLPIITLLCVVPIITMRLLSEEQRSGTLEVLLTAPVSEWSVVLSKFFAALRFFLLLWYPWGLYLIALRIGGGEEFDYRPLLSFALALLITGAHFVAMGLFFSSVTRNQIAAAILTLMGMVVLTVLFIFRGNAAVGGAWRTVLDYVSYLYLWQEAVEGNVAPRLYIFHLSAAVFWLFLTVRVLDARRWR